MAHVTQLQKNQSIYLWSSSDKVREWIQQEQLWENSMYWE